MKSIMGTRKGICYLCGRWGYTEEHHIFGGKPNRKYSEKYGLKVNLCVECHRTGKQAAHRNDETAEKLHEEGQKMFEERFGTREEFRKIFGKSWL